MIKNPIFSKERLEYLKLLSKSYPSIQSAATEYINLSAILNLPKPTEHFLSDIHGEHDAFIPEGRTDLQGGARPFAPNS